MAIIRNSRNDGGRQGFAARWRSSEIRGTMVVIRDSTTLFFVFGSGLVSSHRDRKGEREGERERERDETHAFCLCVT